MPFHLFKKKLKPEEATTRRCVCQPSKATVEESPFEEEVRLTGPYEHENVSLAMCSSCGSKALYYSADVYDDLWQYWCLINEAEHAQLLEEDDPDEPQRPLRARKILEEHVCLVRGPVRGFEWAPSGCTVVEGPPW
jgi:hypothetical protein